MTYSRTDVDQVLLEIEQGEQRREEAVRRFRERERAAERRKQDRIFVLAVGVTAILAWVFLVLVGVL